MCQKITFNLENKKCICQENVFVSQVTGSTFFYFLSYAYLKNIYKTLKGIRKTPFVSKLTILLNLWISKFHGRLPKEKHRNYQLTVLNTTPYVVKLTLVWNILLILPFTVFEEQFSAQRFCKLLGKKIHFNSKNWTYTFKINTT